MRKMSNRLLPTLAVLAGLYTGCENKPMAYEPEAAVLSADKAVADTTVIAPAGLPDRQFVRTANLKFRVQDVSQTTHAVEDLASKYGGFVTQNNLSSTVMNTNTVQITADSLLETTEYRVENNLALRVPNQNLDSMLRELSKQVHFLDYRIVNADDVSLQLLENKLRLKRVTQADKRLEKAIDSRGRKLGESMQAEQDRLALQQDADQRTLHTLTLADQVNYSTVKLAIYQHKTTLQEKRVAPLSPPIYEPSLALQLSEAFLNGWKIFEALLVFVTQLWALWVLGLLVWLGYRKYGASLLSK